MAVGHRAEERESPKSHPEMLDARLHSQCMRKLTEESSVHLSHGPGADSSLQR